MRGTPARGRECRLPFILTSDRNCSGRFESQERAMPIQLMVTQFFVRKIKIIVLTILTYAALC
jgi:hypothetical protein